MVREETSTLILIAVVIVAVFSLGLALTSFATHESVDRMMGWGGGGMMSQPGSTTSGPGGLEWGILALSAGILVVAAVLLVRARGVAHRAPVTSELDTRPAAPAATSPPPATAEPVPAGPASAPVPEPTLVRLLSADERRMYLELRDHGGEMLQRDLVASGMFSKAKVTRVLDKLESKGIVVREAHGMTNRVRLVAHAAR